MKTIVAKFGGSSLADAAQIRKAAAIVLADPDRRFVVASAPGKRGSGDTKVTDLLYQCYEAAAAGADFEPALEKIRQRFRQILTDLEISFPLEAQLEIIRTHLKTAPQRDYMASRGEFLNAQILASYLGWRFLDTAPLVRFFPDGRLDDEMTQKLLSAALNETERAVLPGFYGAEEDGTIRTFSRGGSDITGSLAAAAADAAIYENWTDVSGMLFTDPRIVPSPKTISYITYRELRELSYMGASVMHEDAVFPVRKAGIPINIRNTNRPEDSGTMIVRELPESVEVQNITGIAGKTGFTSISVAKSMMNGEVGFGAKLLSIFASHGISFEHCPTGIDTMSVIVGTAHFEQEREAVLEEIRRELQPELMRVEENLALIVVVGRGMVNAMGSAAKIFGALAADGINVRMVDQGSSEMSVIIGVSDADFENAIRSIYASCTN